MKGESWDRKTLFGRLTEVSRMASSMEVEESEDERATMKSTLRHAIGVSADASTQANGIEGLQSSSSRHLQVESCATNPDLKCQPLRKRR